MDDDTAGGPLDRARAASASEAQEFGDFWLARFLDLAIDYDDEAQTCTARLPYAAHLGNPQGTVHGGVIATVLDITMGHLIHRFLSTAMTIEMDLRFFRPLTGDGTATARLLKPGRRVVHVESRMSDAEGRPVAHAVGSWHRLDALQDRS